MDVQQLFKNLRKEAECPLCLETVNEPKTLPCLHSFCLLCLDKHAAYARRQLQTTIKCPVCLTCFPIPEGDTFGGLPTSFHLNRLVDLLALRDGGAEAQRCSSCEENNTATCYCFVCQNFLCTACFEAHQRLKATRGHRNIFVENLQAQDVQELIHRPVMCSQQYHEDQALEYYCEECKVCICHKCSVVSHNRHAMVDMQKAADEQKMQISDALEKIKAEVAIYENQMEKETELMAKIKLEISVAQRKMTQTVNECIRILTEHKSAMNAKFDEINLEQQKAHATQLETFQFAVTQLKSSVEQGESILQRNINAEILQTKQVIIGRCEELLKARKPEIYEPPHVHYVVENKSDILDRVVVSNTDPSLSLVEGKWEKETEEKTEASFTIVTRDSDGVQCYHGDDHINTDIQTPSGDKLKTEMKDSNDGKYSVTYTPECVGQYKVGIEINGQPLTGSPWSVQVVPSQPKFYKPRQAYCAEENKADILDGVVVRNADLALSLVEGRCGEKETEEESETSFKIVTRDSDGIQSYHGDDHINVDIQTPSADKLKTEITENKGGEYTVAPECVGQYRVLTGSAWGAQVAPHQYQFLFKFGSSGNGPGQFNTPVAIAVSEITGTIAVADYNNRRIQIFSSDGDYLREIVFKHKCAIVAFTNLGNVIAVVFAGDQLQISLFTENGQFIKHINAKHLKAPFHVSVGSDGYIVACDWAKNSVIKVLSPDGTRLLQSFLASALDETLYCTVYHHDTFFVSDAKSNCIKVFNKEGMFRYNIGCKGSGDGQLSYPAGLAIDKLDNLIVCDAGNRRLQLFTLDGKLVTKIEQHFSEDGGAPSYVAMSNNGYVFVTDHKKACVHVFSLEL